MYIHKYYTSFFDQRHGCFMVCYVPLGRKPPYYKSMLLIFSHWFHYIPTKVFVIEGGVISDTS